MHSDGFVNGTALAPIPGMSRVERRERDEQWDATERRRRPPIEDNKPSQAEGDEATVDQALRNEEVQDSRPRLS